MAEMRKEIREMLDRAANRDLQTVMLEQKMNSLFKFGQKDASDRYGLHASAIIVSEEVFCYREQVLSLFYRRNNEKELPVRMLRVFAEGTSIHQKWQDLFVKTGIAVTIEHSYFDERYDLSYTPDAEIRYQGEEPIVEIKSVNTKQFRKMERHVSGEKQLNLYLYLRKKKWGFVLMEDKNTQDIKVQVVRFDKEMVRPYVDRLKKVRDLKGEFIDTKQAPKRKCKSQECKRAVECPMRDACWNIGMGRVKLGKKETCNRT